MRLDAQQPRRIKHRSRVRLRKTSPLIRSSNTSAWRRAMSASLCPAMACSRSAATVDHLLRRAAADPELQPAAGDDVRRARVLHHVERVLIAHVDHGGPNPDQRVRAPIAASSGRASSIGERNGAREACAIGTQLLGSDSEFDRLQQRVGRGAYLRTVRISPVPKRQEPDLLQRQISLRTMLS